MWGSGGAHSNCSMYIQALWWGWGVKTKGWGQAPLVNLVLILLDLLYAEHVALNGPSAIPFRVRVCGEVSSGVATRAMYGGQGMAVRFFLSFRAWLTEILHCRHVNPELNLQPPNMEKTNMCSTTPCPLQRGDLV